MRKLKCTAACHLCDYRREVNYEDNGYWGVSQSTRGLVELAVLHEHYRDVHDLSYDEAETHARRGHDIREVK